MVFLPAHVLLRRKKLWRGLQPQAHQEGDEIFVIRQGRIIVAVEGERVEIATREFCAFPRVTLAGVGEAQEE